MKAVVHDWTSLDAATTAGPSDPSSTETVSDKVLKAVGELTADLKQEVTSATASATETVKKAATTVKEVAEEAAHTVETLTGFDTLKPEEKPSTESADKQAESKPAPETRKEGKQ
jgi:hypothetical protein